MYLSLAAKELKICGGVKSGGEVCCSADMEIRLQARARDKHEKATKESLQRLHQILSMRSTRFHSEYDREPCPSPPSPRKGETNAWHSGCRLSGIPRSKKSRVNRIETRRTVPRPEAGGDSWLPAASPKSADVETQPFRAPDVRLSFSPLFPSFYHI